MKTNHLYRMRFTDPEGWSVSLAGQDSSESQLFLLAEGTCEGKLGSSRRTLLQRQRWAAYWSCDA